MLFGHITLQLSHHSTRTRERNRLSSTNTQKYKHYAKTFLQKQQNITKQQQLNKHLCNAPRHGNYSRISPSSCTLACFLANLIILDMADNRTEKGLDNSKSYYTPSSSSPWEKHDSTAPDLPLRRKMTQLPTN